MSVVLGQLQPFIVAETKLNKRDCSGNLLILHRELERKARLTLTSATAYAFQIKNLLLSFHFKLSGFLPNFATQIFIAMSKVKVGLVQMSCTKDKQENLDKAIVKVREAAAKGAQIVCLQELFTSLYFCDVEDYDNFDLAEKIPGPSTDALQIVAKELGVVIIASLFEKRAEGLYHNTTAVLDADGSYLGKYRKMHIPDDPAFYEKFYFTPGDLGYKVFQTKFAKIGILICWDQWYPEASRITALMGADIMFYPTAIGWATDQDEETNQDQYNAWQTIQRSHAVANGVPVVSVNRVGFEQDGAMKFWGGSFATNAQGKLLYLASHDREETTVVELDLSQSDFMRKHWPFLRDRRIDSYQPITKRYIDED